MWTLFISLLYILIIYKERCTTHPHGIRDSYHKINKLIEELTISAQALTAVSTVLGFRQTPKLGYKPATLLY